VLVIETDRETGNIVVSQRDLVMKEQTDREDEVFGALHIDSIIEGKVTRLTNFGAFVDVGGAEGLVHISEIAWTRTDHPSQLLACGDVVKVKVLDTDTDKKKISLSIKQAQEDPWDSIETRFKIDQVINGTVTRIAKYGMFVKVSDEFEGLLHNSEVPSGENQKPPEVNETINVKILNIDKQGRRLKLGLATSSEQSLPSEMDRYIDHGSSGMKLGDVMKGSLDDGASSGQKSGDAEIVSGDAGDK
jgi:small subunit ribosomal protein S1